ncbi:uncharacterized protein L201_000973 [Kwoniella dendrophila CBS 6074]|uniref:Protein kinase domain-containing protein n=1 Tax=Kwoniella dendrophila CBS 6074 TaxID=1295534 RepID=A0AAX4JL26_9TREE
MSLLRNSSPHHSILHPSSSTSSVMPASSSTSVHDPYQSRSASSRNDLFTTSWQPEIPPPRPLPGSSSNAIESSYTPNVPSSSSLNSIFDLGGSGYHANTLPSPARKRGGELGLKMDFEGIGNAFTTSTTASSASTGVDEFGVTLSNKSSFPNLNKNDISPSPRTSSFFDTPTESITPPPAPRLVSSINASTNGISSFAPSPLTLSRSSSNRKIPPPLPISSNNNSDIPSSSSSIITPSTSIASASTSTRKQRSNDSYTDPLSPLHQSPQLPPTSGVLGSNGLENWKLPLPPCSDDIELRLIPNSTYLLGEGRYARAYLASYKRTRRKNRNGSNTNNNTRHGNDLLSRSNGSVYSNLNKKQQEMEVNEDGDGLIGGNWKLCAAKRLAPDRESQTMGLREAFFLNRLAGPLSKPISTDRIQHGGKIRPRQRAVSPLRGNHQAHISSTDRNEGSDRSKEKSRRPCGSVYVVKLIAVKEDSDGLPSTIGQTHARSSSDILTGSSATTTTATTDSNKVLLPNPATNTDLRRQRSSTIITAHAPLPPGGDGGTLPSYPSLPSLVQSSSRYEQSNPPQPSLSRLVLLLEHAPLGTLDRILRTSPQLVGKSLWERWAREGAEALEWVHGKGVVHADVKPGNLLLTADLHIRLSDFGSSLLIHPAHPPTDGLGLGTLPFSPPELVDPNQTFSFPVDIFALGATLYQCLTGREPFRGIRTVEMMHHVRKGGLWAYEERERFQRIGNEDGVSTAGSPYPSAWRGYSATSTGAGYPSGSNIGVGGGVRRAGSLRVPPSYSREHLAAVVDGHNHGVKPKLKRMTSAESIRASDEASSSESPSGVKLYANWVKSGPGLDAITRLLSDEDEFDISSPTYGISRGNSLRRAQEKAIQQQHGTNETNSNSNSELSTSLPKAIVQLPTPISPSSARLPNPDDTIDDCDDKLIQAENEKSIKRIKSLMEPYQDGSPSMLFLDGRERVSEKIRQVIQIMLSPLAENRFTAEQVRMKWDELKVGLEDDDEEEDDGADQNDGDC